MALTFEQVAGMDLVIKQTERASQWAAAEIWDGLGSFLSWRSSAGFYDSPLEVVFDAWWRVMTIAQRLADDVELKPQYEVVTTARGNRYRIDFLLEPCYDDKVWFDARGYEWPLIAVELDGHDFHERTKEQVEYRNQRDRDLQADGWIVLHFSGSELVREPERCVTEAYEQAQLRFGSHKRQIASAERAADIKTDA